MGQKAPLILLVDDEVMICSLVVEFLRKKGVEDRGRRLW